MAIRAWAHDQCFSLFSPDDPGRVDTLRWIQQAETFLSARIDFVQTFTDPSGTLPSHASFEIDVGPKASTESFTRVQLLTVPITPSQPPVEQIVQRAHQSVIAMGGAGFDALLARARRLWQVRTKPVVGTDPCASLIVTATVAMVFTAPILAPDGGALFGVKGARVRLETMGWNGM
jgi:hypothetical protein